MSRFLSGRPLRHMRWMHRIVFASTQGEINVIFKWVKKILAKNRKEDQAINLALFFSFFKVSYSKNQLKMMVNKNYF